MAIIGSLSRSLTKNGAFPGSSASSTSALAMSLSRSLGKSSWRDTLLDVAFHLAPRSPHVLPSPSRDLAQFALLEDQYCKDFTCCNLSLENLHDLLQHFEEAHVHASDFDDDEDTDENSDDNDMPIHFMDGEDMDMDDAFPASSGAATLGSGGFDAFGLQQNMGFGSPQPQEDEDDDMAFLRSQLAASLQAVTASQTSSPSPAPQPQQQAGISIQDIFSSVRTPQRSHSTSSATASTNPYDLSIVNRRRPGSSTSSPSLSRVGSSSGAAFRSSLVDGSSTSISRTASPQRFRDHAAAGAVHKVRSDLAEPPAPTLPYSFGGTTEIVSDADTDMEDATATATGEDADEEDVDVDGDETPVAAVQHIQRATPSKAQQRSPLSLRRQESPVSSGASTPRRSSFNSGSGSTTPTAATSPPAPSAVVLAAPAPAAPAVSAKPPATNPASVDQLFGPLVTSLQNALGLAHPPAGMFPPPGTEGMMMFLVPTGAPIPPQFQHLVPQQPPTTRPPSSVSSPSPPPLMKSTAASRSSSSASVRSASSASSRSASASPTPTLTPTTALSAAQASAAAAAAMSSLMFGPPSTSNGSGSGVEDDLSDDGTLVQGGRVGGGGGAVAQGASGPVVGPGGERPYRCKVDGCGKAYKNPGGLKYHVLHGHAEDTGDPEINNIIQKPYLCTVPECGKRYKNLNGLKYHIEHAHAALLGNDA
ncbi:hypothetical protein HDU67_003016 [Dinochytrium kinnereticum]|nr:hypothetical protein HDU67_003016 [Dinochytrium kinnereticum]